MIKINGTVATWDRLAEASLTGDASLLEYAGRHRGEIRQHAPAEHIGRHSATREIRLASLTRLVAR